MCKRYLAFANANYYPDGGMDDFVGSFDTVEEAGLAIGEYLIKESNVDELSDVWLDGYWWHVWDLNSMNFVEGSSELSFLNLIEN